MSSAGKVCRKSLTSRRKRLLYAFFALIVVVIGPYLVSRVRSPGRQILVRATAAESEVLAKTVSQIRVLSYNIAHGRGATDDNWAGTAAGKRKRIDEIAQLIATTDADVVVLNEVDFCSTWSGHQNQAEAIARATGYPYWVEQRNLDFRFIYGSWKFGNAVLSKFPIVSAKKLPLPTLRYSEHLLAGSKQGAVCTLQLSETQQIRILAVHLEDRSEAIRVSSVTRIVEAVESSKMPLVAVGDFNSTPSSFPHSQSTSAGKNAMDLLIESNQFSLNAEELPTQQEMTYPSISPTRVIDWILIPADWQFADYRVIASHLSDHRPVVADLKLPERDPE